MELKWLNFCFIPNMVFFKYIKVLLNLYMKQYFKHILLAFILLSMGKVTMQAQSRLPQIANVVKDSVYTFHTYVDHVVRLKLNECDPALIELRSKEAQISKLNDTTYYVRYSYLQEESKIKLYYKNLPIQFINVKVKNIAMPEIKFGKESSKILHKAELSTLNDFSFDFNNSLNISSRIELYSCKIVIVEPNKPVPFSWNVNTYILPPHIKQMIAKLPLNAQIIFQDISVKTSSNNIINLIGEPIAFKIIE
jgi:hypothetical protein